MRFKEIKPGMVIHCPKEEDANTLLKHLESIGYVWDDEYECKRGNQYAGWSYYGSDTCFGTGQDSRIIVWSRLQTWQKAGLEITEFSDLIEHENSTQNSTGGDTSIDPQDGKWERIINAYGETESFMCECGYTSHMASNFCPVCGQNMYAETSARSLDTSTEMSAVEVLEWLSRFDAEQPMKDVFNVDFDTEVIAEYEPQEIVDKITAYEAERKESKPVEVEFGWHCEILKMGEWGVMETVDQREMWEGNESTAMDEAAERAKQYAVENGVQTYFRVYGICRVKGAEDE